MAPAEEPAAPGAEPEAKRQRAGGAAANGKAPLVILDGGCGLELKRRKAQGKKVAYNLQLFTSAALIETPAGVRELHDDYVAAGARVVTTATFAVSRHYLDKQGHGDRVPELAQLAVMLACQSADAAARSGAGPVRVAGSVPPLTECYRVDLQLPTEVLAGEYRELLAAMAEPAGLDLWLCETMASLKEARAAVTACRTADPKLPVWLAFVLRQSRKAPYVEIIDGSPVVEAAKLAKEMGAEALLFNCSTPQLIGAALAALAEERDAASGLQLGGYGNFWEEHKPGWSIEDQETESGKGDKKKNGLQVRDISVDDYVESARQWVASGANIIGGCCGIGPGHIRAVAEALRS